MDDITHEEIDAILEQHTTQFKDKFQNKLQNLNSVTTPNQDDRSKEQLNNTLQRYVNELNEQNDILVQTIEELETDCNDRVNHFEKKLKHANSTIKEKTDKCEHLQLKLNNYEDQKREAENHLQVLEEEAITMGEENMQYQSLISNLEHDIDELIILIKNARSSGSWDLSSMNLKAVSIDNILDSSTIGNPLPRSSNATEATNEYIDQLKAQLNARDQTILMLEKDLSGKTSQYNFLTDQYSHTGEVMDSVKNDIKQLEQQQQHDCNQLSQKDILIRNLKQQILSTHDQIDELNEQLEIISDDVNHYRIENNELKDALELRLDELNSKNQTIYLLENRSHNYPQIESISSSEQHFIHQNHPHHQPSIHENIPYSYKQSSNEIKDLQRKIDELENEKLTFQRNCESKLQEVKKYEREVHRLHEKLEAELSNVSELNRKLDEVQNDASQLHSRKKSEVNLQVKNLENQLKKLQDQKSDSMAKVVLRDQAINRLQEQQKGYMDEVTRRDTALHEFELKILKLEDEKRRETEKWERHNRNFESTQSQLKTLKEQHDKILVEKGRLEAQVNAHQISNESDNHVLTEEFVRREETISTIKIRNAKLSEENKNMKEKMKSKGIENEKWNKELIEKLQQKEKFLVEKENKISELTQSLREHENKIDQYEDEAREIVLKLNSVERNFEQERHKTVLSEEQISELSSEIDIMQIERKNLSFQVASLNQQIEKLSKENNEIKKSIQLKDKQIFEHEDLLRISEQQLSVLSNEMESLQQTSNDDFTTHEHKLKLMEEELELSHQRYSDVNEELTSVESQLELFTSRYKEASDIADQLLKKLEEVQEEKEELEMSIAVTSEKHETATMENAQKDQTILNLKSEISVTQQEFEEVIEELSQKNEEIEKLNENIAVLEEKMENLEKEKVQLSLTHGEQIDEINKLQVHNSTLAKNLCESKECMIKIQEDYTSTDDSNHQKIKDLLQDNDQLKTDVETSSMRNIQLEKELSSIRERNLILNHELEEVTAKRQQTLSEIEELQATFEDYQSDKENDLRIASDKISELESKLHEMSLAKSQLEGELKLTEEKLKNASNQYQDADSHVEQLKDKLESLQFNVKELDESVITKSIIIDQLEKTCHTNNIKLQENADAISQLKSNLKESEETLSDSKLRNTRCEEIIREIRDKYGNKIKEGEHQSQLITELQKEYKSLQEIHSKIQDEFRTAEQMNNSYAEEIDMQRDELSRKQQELNTLNSNVDDLTSNLEVVLKERSSAQEQVKQFEEKFSSLKTSLEQDNFRLLEENCVVKQTLKDNKDEIKLLTEENRMKDEEIHIIDKKVIHLEEELVTKDHDLKSLKEEAYNSEQTINEIHSQLQQTLEDKKILLSESSGNIHQVNLLQTNIIDIKQQYKDIAQQLAHYQEKYSLCERNLNSTQEQLNNRIAEAVKLEKHVRKSQTDLKQSHEQFKSKEAQIGQYNQLLEQTRHEFNAVKQKYDACYNELEAAKSTLTSYDQQLTDAHRQTEELSIQLEQHQTFIDNSEKLQQETEGNLKVLQIKFESASHELDEYKENMNLHIEREEELVTKLKERDSGNSHLHQELENCLQKNKSLLEQIGSKDAEIRILKSELNAYQKKGTHQEKQMQRKSEQSENLRREIEELKNSTLKCHQSISSHEIESNKLRTELSTTQASLKESVLQFTQKTKELATLKSELLHSNEKHNELQHSLSLLESKNKKLKSELKRNIDKFKNTSTEMSHLSKSVSDTKSQLQQLSGENMLKNSELGKRDDRIVALKVDLSSTEERLKLRDEENDRLKNENLRLSQQYHRQIEQFNQTEQELEAVKANGDRLTRESELVVENMNTWVKEQRQGNEKIANKMGYLNDKISTLEKRNAKLMEENKHIKKDLHNYKMTLDDRKIEVERLQKQRSQATEQELELRESNNKIKTLEEMLGKEQAEIKSLSQQYQERHRLHVDTIQQLHKQLSDMNSENLRQRALLESQTFSRKNLQARLKSKENDIELLKDDINRSISNGDEFDSSNLTSRINTDSSIPTRMSSGRPLLSDSVSTLLAKEIERSGMTSEEALDKSYWVQRVGDLSEQLQRSSEYWSQKLHNVSNANAYEFAKSR